MGKWDGLDRRKFPRVAYPCLVVIRHEQPTPADVILTHTENVGIGGVCVILKHNLRMFSPVEIEVDLLDMSEHIKCLGKVVWNIQRKGDSSRKPNSFDIGIEFENLPDSDRQRLDDVVKRMLKHNREVPYR